MTRPLYLQGCSGMRVVFDEPALVVSVPDKTRQFFPLPRVSRVIVTGNVEWSMGALFACADAGISVLFIDDVGTVRGRWLGMSQGKENTLESLARLLQHPTAENCYRNWYTGMQRMAARSAARRLLFSDWQTADLAQLDRWAQNSLTTDWLAIRSWLQGVILSAVMQYLVASGVDANSDLAGDGDFCLADDIALILAIDFLPALVSWQQKYNSVPGRSVLLTLFDQRGQRLEHLLRGVLVKLHQCLLGVH